MRKRTYRLGVIAVEEGICRALLVSSSCSTNTVNVVFSMRRIVEVDNVVYIADI